MVGHPGWRLTTGGRGGGRVPLWLTPVPVCGVTKNVLQMRSYLEPLPTKKISPRRYPLGRQHSSGRAESYTEIPEFPGQHQSINTSATATEKSGGSVSESARGVQELTDVSLHFLEGGLPSVARPCWLRCRVKLLTTSALGKPYRQDQRQCARWLLSVLRALRSRRDKDFDHSSSPRLCDRGPPTSCS
jgi:hypothetical protein